MERIAVTIALLGGSGVGKTSICKMYTGCHPTFEDSTPEGTDEVAIFTSEVTVGGIDFALELADTPADTDGDELCRQIIQQAQGFICVFSIDDSPSFASLDAMVSTIRSFHDALKIPVMICGHKSDLEDTRTISQRQVIEFAQSHKCALIETSTENPTGIETMFDTLLKEMYRIRQEPVIPTQPLPKKQKRIRKLAAFLMRRPSKQALIEKKILLDEQPSTTFHHSTKEGSDLQKDSLKEKKSSFRGMSPRWLSFKKKSKSSTKKNTQEAQEESGEKVTIPTTESNRPELPQEWKQEEQLPKEVVCENASSIDLEKSLEIDRALTMRRKPLPTPPGSNPSSPMVPPRKPLPSIPKGPPPNPPPKM